MNDAPPVHVSLAWPDAPAGVPPALNRFLIAAITFRRVHQLQYGARARVDRGDHKVTRVALLETMAATIAWTAGPEHAAGHSGSD
jgi:DNA-directed RNA polymerase subunit K/omega